MDKKKIYIGEDQPVLVKLIKTALGKREGYEPSFFSDGLDLYRKLQDFPPDMLVLDIIMPSMTGLAIARLVKFHEHYSHIPVLMMSSITDRDIRDRVEKVGANAFLPKPFKVNDLLSEIDRLIIKNTIP
ncbi:MAG: response regulator [Candidatus Eremiobacterota bacterium]